jgi:transposase InsO family protein
VKLLNHDRGKLRRPAHDPRLARNGRDWHHLIELCGLVGALVVDADGIYNPAKPNDRLLLGLKGTMSEFELTTLRARLLEAAVAKARRGELRLPVPGERVTRVLERLRETRGLPSVIQADNGPELAVRPSISGPMIMVYSCSLSNPASRSRTRRSRVSTPGRAKNALTNTSSFRSTMRGGRSNSGELAYNCERPHSSLGNLTPQEFAAHPSRAPLGQRKKCWPPHCSALQLRIQNPTVFRPPSKRDEGWPEKL